MSFRRLAPLVLLAAATSVWAGPGDGKSPKKILLVLTSHEDMGKSGKKTGFYLSEAAHPFEVFTKAGAIVDFVSPKGGKPPIDGIDLTDPVNKAFVESPEIARKLEQSLKPADVDPAQYAAIFYVGGHGAMWDFPDDAKLAEIAGKMYDAGGVVAAVCHGPAGLVGVKLANGKLLIEGKEVACFTNDEEAQVGTKSLVPFLLETRLTGLRARVRKAGNFQPNVIVSERLVTGQNPASARGVAESVVALLAQAMRKK